MVWEEVDDDNDDGMEVVEGSKPKAVAATASSNSGSSVKSSGKGPSGNANSDGGAVGSKGGVGPKKQAGLMGFFAKK